MKSDNCGAKCPILKGVHQTARSPNDLQIQGGNLQRLFTGLVGTDVWSRHKKFKVSNPSGHPSAGLRCRSKNIKILNKIQL